MLAMECLSVKAAVRRADDLTGRMVLRNRSYNCVMAIVARFPCFSLRSNFPAYYTLRITSVIFPKSQVVANMRLEHWREHSYEWH
jgi:hypothetical protein